MKIKLLLAAALMAAPALAQSDTPAAEAAALSPGEIVAAASASEWVTIAPDDLLVMDLAPGAAARPRRVVIQLVPAPFSEPWVANIRTLAEAHWWDGLAIVRAQDNYVVQWGDPDGEDAAKARALPATLRPTGEAEYAVRGQASGEPLTKLSKANRERLIALTRLKMLDAQKWRDPYAEAVAFVRGFPVAAEMKVAATAPPSAMQGIASVHEYIQQIWPVHCYGTVGVGRNLSPDAGSGAELYTVIGHAPRHLDRNIAVVGRVIEGIEHLSTLPRGTGELGFYKTPEERTPIAVIRLGSEVQDVPPFQYLSTESETFARYAEARANRRDAFFIVPAGGADVCNITVPVRRAPG
ncbi:peptidylprolyl isomerase [Tsuneonella sp. HG249]